MRVSLAAASLLVAVVVVLVVANPRPQSGDGSGESAEAKQQQEAVQLLASQGTVFEPATSHDRETARSLPEPPKLGSIGLFDRAPARARKNAKLYLGRLREVNGPNLGPHGAWTVVERGSSTPHQSRPRGRLAYVAEIRDVPACSVEISCPLVPGAPGPKPFEEYFAYIDAKTGRTLGGLGLPEGYSRQHGLDGSPPPATARFDDGQISFRYPVAWQKLNPRASSSFSTPLVDLGTEKLHSPCSHPRPGLLSCGLPLDRLPASGVLVLWAEIAMSGLQLGDEPGVATTIDGQRARVSSSAAGCERLGADAGRTVTIKRAPAYNFFQMRACIAGGDGGSGARAVDRLIDSIRIAG